MSNVAALRPHVVIIGGGFAGLDAARALKRAPVLDHANRSPQSPRVSTAAVSGGGGGAVARGYCVANTVGAPPPGQRPGAAGLVTSIDADSKAVVLDDGERLPYDYLIVAAGATHSYFGHEDWARARPGLKTLDDALSMRRRMLLAFEEAEREKDPARQRHLLTFVLIGGGPTGVELAGALAEIARHTLRREYRHDRSGISAHRPDRSGRHDSSEFSAVATRLGATGAAQARRRGLGDARW